MPTGVETTATNFYTYANTFSTLEPYMYWNSNSCNTRSDNITFATVRDLDRLCRKMYKIITEHVQLDISEEEFMNILNND